MRKSPGISILVNAIFLAVVSTLLVGQTPTYPAYKGHVNDFANVLDADTKSQLETVLTNFESVAKAQIAVVTVTTVGERPIEDYSLGLYRTWGIGAKTGADKDKGALLLIATQDRKSRMEVGYGLEGDLPDGLAGEMLRRMRPYFQQQQWSQGVTVGTRTLVDTLAQKWNLPGFDQSYAYKPQTAPDEVQVSPKTLLIIAIAVVLLFLLLAWAGRRGGGGPKGGTGWWAAPMIFHQGGGGFGGSSWGSGGGWSGGGGGGGGGWGGFGGGSSGGGGASDSW